MNVTILERRATLFVGRPIKITSENLSLFVSTFGQLGLFPTVNKGIGIKVTPKGIEPEDIISLDMKYLDETLKVSIGPDRFDIASKKISENWDSFREFIEKIHAAVTGKLGQEIVRYAQCATIKMVFDQEHIQAAYSKLFVSQGDTPIEWQLRKVVRTSITSSQKEYSLNINNVYNLSRNMVVVNGEDLSSCVMLEMDVNTVVGSENNALAHLHELFWVDSACTIDKAISSYYSILSDEK